MFTYPSVVLYKTATLGCENNRAWLVQNGAELASAINEIFKLYKDTWQERKVKVEELTPFTIDSKVNKQCNQVAQKAFDGQIFVKKLAYNQTKNDFSTWDI